jgi:hypothetical protein
MAEWSKGNVVIRTEIIRQWKLLSNCKIFLPVCASLDPVLLRWLHLTTCNAAASRPRAIGTAKSDLRHLPISKHPHIQLHIEKSRWLKFQFISRTLQCKLSRSRKEFVLNKIIAHCIQIKNPTKLKATLFKMLCCRKWYHNESIHPIQTLS